MSFKTILGQPLAVELAKRWLTRRATQPLLLYGPEGVGKRTLALEIAKALNCQNPVPSPLMGEGRPPKASLADGGDGGVLKTPPPQSRHGESPAETSPTKGEEALWDSCDHCISCRKISGGYHPDVRVLDLAYQALERDEPLAKQQTLRIETILKERRRLYETAVEGPWKVSLLDDAHRLTADAANVLLKILEEPPPQTLIFLVTPYRERLFATLISRCQTIRFRGRPAREAVDSEGAAEAETLWQTLPQMTTAQILAHSPGRGKSATLDRALIEERLANLLDAALRTLRAGQRNAAPCVEQIQKAQLQLRKNVQAGLVYDNLLLQLSSQRREPS